jgi:hypothetical protein
MTDMRPFGWADVLWLLLVVTLAGGARAGYVWHYADAGRNSGPYRVQDVPEPVGSGSPDPATPNELETLVQNIETRQWYGSKAPFAPGEEATAHYSPGLPWLLGSLARAVGQDDRARFGSWVRWLQCGFGTATAGLYFLFARRAFRSRAVGVLAGLAVAVHPFAVISCAEIQDGVLASFLLALVLFLGARSGQTAAPLASLLYGLALAGLALVRAACLPFSFVALGWFLVRCRTLPRGWLCAVLAFLGFVNALAPWMVRNFETFGEPVPVVDSCYLHLWVGNNPQATGGPASASAYRAAPSRALAEIPTGQQPLRYDRLGQVVLEEVRTRPVPTLRRRLLAALSFLFGEQCFTARRLAEPSVPGEELVGVEETLHATLLGVLALAFLGWRWSYGWRRESLPAALAVIWLPLPYILGHAEGLSGPRLPLDGLLSCYAVFALLCLVPGLGRYLREGNFSAAAPGIGSGTTPLQLPAPPGSTPGRTSRGPSWR